MQDKNRSKERPANRRFVSVFRCTVCRSLTLHRPLPAIEDPPPETLFML